jgi:hypothetical protein
MGFPKICNTIHEWGRELHSMCILNIVSSHELHYLISNNKINITKYHASMSPLK